MTIMKNSNLKAGHKIKIDGKRRTIRKSGPGFDHNKWILSMEDGSVYVRNNKGSEEVLNV